MSKTADSNMSDKVICRTCANENSSLVPIFVHRIENELIKDVLISCTSIKVVRYQLVKMVLMEKQISEHDLLPKNICNTCLNILGLWYKFRKKCEENDLELRNTLITKQLKVFQPEKTWYSNLTFTYLVQLLSKCNINNILTAQNCT